MVTTFKAEFGNQNHIRILGMMRDLEKLKDTLKFKQKSARGIKKLQADIDRQEKQIAFLVEKENVDKTV